MLVEVFINVSRSVRNISKSVRNVKKYISKNVKEKRKRDIN